MGAAGCLNVDGRWAVPVWALRGWAAGGCSGAAVVGWR